jgi:putative membrane-bound dehydrogenase-like protein
MKQQITLICAGLAALLSATHAETNGVTPGLFQCIDPSLEVTVWAAGKDVQNPSNIDIDAKGRIWVAEGVNYRKHLDRKPEGDRIMVHEDTDNDGKADKSWVFVQEPFLKCPLGVAVIDNKVVVSMAPDLIVYTDVNRDAKFDAAVDKREVLLTGFNGRNHDHSIHSVTVGPEGKWYFSAGNCGAKFKDKTGKQFRIGSAQGISWWPKDPAVADFDPNTIAGQKSDDGNVYIGGFIARMDPDGSNVEVLCHNLRNSYENCVTSMGDVFSSDNDDQPACRVFAVLPGGNHGFASADGQRAWQADRRPGQSIQTATWRQEDPGVAPAGDIYGGGSPTGCVYYENGALGTAHEGTLLVCEPGRNTIFGYKPKKQGHGWKLERFNFLTTNTDGKFKGTDFTNGNKSATAADESSLFRPSDVAVGADGALYVSDWYDPRVGGHADMDDGVGGAIYRIAPKGFKPQQQAVDLANPAVNVRAVAAATLRSGKQDAVQEIIAKGGIAATRAKNLLTTPQATIPTAEALDHTDAAAVEAWGMAQKGKESSVYAEILAKHGDADPLKWSEKFAKMAWRLHPAESIAAFAKRAQSDSLSLAARTQALTALGFRPEKAAADAMLAAADTKDSTLKATATWWLLNRKDTSWKDHGVAEALKTSGVYDPEKLTILALQTPPATPNTLGEPKELAKLKGDAKAGKTAAAACMMCHKIDGQGADFGPDLATWGHSQPIETIIRAIVEPNADIAHGYYGTEVTLKTGEVINGVVYSENDPLIIGSQGGISQMIPKARIASKNGMDRTLMMSASQLGLNGQQVADIAAFLKQGL